ncbi:MAG: hypothetical protein GF334_02260 [Candidatus Altiarchaeales archaeon]|nr:hypothetical protein [Candidatus Altiarchaeales archaeon]
MRNILEANLDLDWMDFEVSDETAGQAGKRINMGFIALHFLSGALGVLFSYLLSDEVGWSLFLYLVFALGVLNFYRGMILSG